MARLCNSTRGQVSFGMPALPFFFWGSPALLFSERGTPIPPLWSGGASLSFSPSEAPPYPRSRAAEGAGDASGCYLGSRGFQLVREVITVDSTIKSGSDLWSEEPMVSNGYLEIN